jgi:hypothetical protein
MKKTDSGHVKNDAQFGEIVGYIDSLGSDYNPANQSIKLDTLTTKKTEMTKSLDLIDECEAKYKEAIRVRQEDYNKLEDFTSKIIYALSSSDVDVKTVSDAKSISKKILGSSKPKKKDEPPPENMVATVNSDENVNETETQTDSPQNNGRSTAQRSFDRRLGNFKKLVALVGNNSAYQPNEADLQTTSLSEFSIKVSENNTLAVKATNALSDARDARDVLFYTATNSTYKTVNKVKFYVKSRFDKNSIQAKTITKFVFAKIV